MSPAQTTFFTAPRSPALSLPLIFSLPRPVTCLSALCSPHWAGPGEDVWLAPGPPPLILQPASFGWGEGEKEFHVLRLPVFKS